MTLGVLGGTFDPIHLGHVAAAQAAQEALSLHSMVLIPSRIPPHRADPVTAGPEDRFAMAQLAATGRPGWSASRMELDRDGPSYTYDTLVELGKSSTQICFITGADAFAEIGTWSRFPSILDLAHFVVIAREGITLDSIGNRLPSLAARLTTPDRFTDSEGTRIILIEGATPAVSSTEIRRRVQHGESIAGMVTPAIDTYIHDHRLYHAPQSGVGR